MVFCSNLKNRRFISTTVHSVNVAVVIRESVKPVYEHFSQSIKSVNISGRHHAGHDSLSMP